jgi:hypothetical protein
MQERYGDMKTTTRLAAIALAMFVSASGVHASSVEFGGEWKEQRFSLFSSNDFGLGGNTLAVASDGTVSMLWKKLPQDRWSARTASWKWQVDRSVPPTDLTQKGGDDRNLSLYFIFMPESVAAGARNADIKDLMDEPAVRILMYVWGGNHPEGAILPTPYLGERGRTIVRRPSGTGSEAEQVDLANDYEAAFGEPPTSLVGLAVSADSDDTDTEIDATISGLRLLP